LDNFLIPAVIKHESERAYLLEIFDEDTGELIQQYDSRHGVLKDDGWFPKSVVKLEKDGVFDVPKWLAEKKRIDIGKWEGY